MRENVFRLAAIGCLLSLSMNGVDLLAQEPNKTAHQDKSATESLPDVLLPQLQTLSASDRAKVLETIFAFKKLVRGQPYSATAVTETLQTLSDGNEITRRIEARIYRDSEGRTRREQTLDSVAKYTAVGSQPQMILIDDPVAGLALTLDPRTRTARKIPGARPLPQIFAQPGERDWFGPAAKEAGTAEPWMTTKPKVAAKQDKPAKPDIKGTVGASAYKGATSSSGQTSDLNPKEHRLRSQEDQRARTQAEEDLRRIRIQAEVDRLSSGRRRVESLGRQVIEGIEAEGTRSTITIPAGEIGNRLPIEITDERWYSPELQILIVTKHHDPRSGDSTYRLTDINRSEPDRSLFEAPPDYRVVGFGPRDRPGDGRTLPAPPKPAVKPEKND
jgi:hypothetical protein